MSGDGLRDEADSFREALPDDVLKRAVRAACDEADWHWEPEYNGEHVLVPSPEDSMEPIVLAVIEAIKRAFDLGEAAASPALLNRAREAEARAEAAEQAVQRVRQAFHRWSGGPDDEFEQAMRRALDGTP